MERVNLLWTGGWDSTFRLLQLSEERKEICVYYFIDNGRKSRDIEMERMKEILLMIKKLPKYIAKISDINYIQVDEVMQTMKNKEISDIYLKLKQKYKLGSQYEWFALYCNYKNIYLEIGIEYSSHSKMLKILNLEQVNLEKIKNDFLEERYIAKNEESLFYNFGKYFIFAITNYSKKDMEKISKEKDWIEIMGKTWFCHNPINKQPCGYCNPCKDAMNLEMEWRMPLSSKLRYYLINRLIIIKNKLNRGR